MFTRVFVLSLTLLVSAFAAPSVENVATMSAAELTEWLGQASVEDHARALQILAREVHALRAENAKLEQANEELRKASLTDPLTGLGNRRSFGALSYAHSRIAFITFDLDHFKRVNDTYGHDAGDVVLRTVAEVARRSVRDPVFRMGGEEFLVVLADTGLEDAQKIAERLRVAIAGATFAHPGLELLRMTGSFGVAAGPSDSLAMRNALLKASDEAAYVAKQTGRNKVVAAPESRVCEVLAGAALASDSF